MRKPDEIAFYAILRRGAPGCNGYAGQPGLYTVDGTALLMGMSLKRAYALLAKWTDQGFWDYGVSLRAGWFTAQAPEKLEP